MHQDFRHTPLQHERRMVLRGVPAAMIVMTFLLMAQLLFSGLAFAAQSNPPSPTPAKTASQPQANAPENQAKPEPDTHAGASRPPVVIELLKATVIRIEATDITEKNNDYASHEWWLVYLTAVLALTTIALACYTALLWRATCSLVGGAKASAEKQLRAYVWHEIGAAPNIDEEFIRVEIIIRNSGSTPAQKTHAWTKIQLVEDADIESYAFENAPPDIQGPRFVINPNSTHTHGGWVKVTNEEKRDLRYGAKVLHIWGEIRYLDVFGGQHWSKFRMYWRYVTEDRAIWAYGDYGNDET